MKKLLSATSKILNSTTKLARIQRRAKKAVSIFTKTKVSLERIISQLDQESAITISRIDDLRSYHSTLIANRNDNTKILQKINTIIEK